jgi:hypothetical protein
LRSDAHDLAQCIKQRAATVAWIEGCTGLRDASV